MNINPYYIYIMITDNSLFNVQQFMCNNTITISSHAIYVYVQINTQCTGKFRHCKLIFTYKHQSIVHVFTPWNVSRNAQRNVLRKVSNTIDGKDCTPPGRQVGMVCMPSSKGLVRVGPASARRIQSNERFIYYAVSVPDWCCSRIQKPRNHFRSLKLLIL